MAVLVGVFGGGSAYGGLDIRGLDLDLNPRFGG